jgi:hypothetical protein
VQVTIDTTAVTAVLGAIAGACTAATVIWVRVIKPAGKMLGWMTEFREDWTGVADRPGVPGRPGMMVRMAAIEGEFRSNGGGSMRDRVNMIESRQMAHESAHAAASVAVAATLDVNRHDNGTGQVAA